MFLPLLVLHIAAGALALLAALIAMASRKRGGGLHARAGSLFVRLMSAMAASAVVLTWWEPDRLTMGAGLWTLYLVHTSQQAVRSRAGKLEGTGLLALIPGFAALLAFGDGALMAAQAQDGQFEGTGMAGFMVFGLFTALSLGFDASLIWRRALAPRQRVARHLWRMTTATFLAVTSLFLGQQDDVFPWMQGSPVLLVPSLLTLVFLLYWILRVRFARNWLGAIIGFTRSKADDGASTSSPLTQKGQA